MFRKTLFLLTIFFTALLQVSFLGVFTGGWPAPHLLLILVLILTYRRRDRESYFCAFLGGFFLDLLGVTQMTGLTSLSLLLAIVSWQGVRRVTAARWPAFLLFVFVISFLNSAFFSYPWVYPWLWPTLSAAGENVLLTALSLAPLTIVFRYLFDEDYWQLDFRNRL